MVLPILILLTSTAFGLFYLQTTCETALKRECDSGRLPSFVDAYRLEFPSVRSELQRTGADVDYKRVCAALQCDYIALTYLLRSSGRETYSRREQLLRLYFRVVSSVASVQHLLKLNEKPTVLKLITILHYFANSLCEQCPVQVGNLIA